LARHHRIVSWNVNGLRACHRKGFLDWLTSERPHIVALQEVRAREDQLAAEVLRPRGWSSHIVAGVRPGYSGVGVYARRKPDEIASTLGVRSLDVEGRVVMARFGKCTVVSAYWPKGGNRENHARIPYKLRFDRTLFRHLLPRVGTDRLLVMGDFNVAHEERDLARPRSNRDQSGFLPVERRAFARWLKAGWVDTFRHFEPGTGHYSWWSQLHGVREKNVGWRIDYVLASPAAMPFVRGAAIHPEVRGSDHAPVSVDVDPGIFD
jgi:exodeoxyribonuclease-3